MNLILKIGYQSFLLDTSKCDIGAVVKVVESLAPVSAEWEGFKTYYAPDPTCTIAIETLPTDAMIGKKPEAPLDIIETPLAAPVEASDGPQGDF